MRFHDLLLEAQKLLKNEEIITFSVYVGQYLPAWRTGVDYRHCYSAKKEEGGGVLRDLSHEIDYAVWLCGPAHKVVAIGGHFSELEINSDDTYSILMSCAHCPVVNIQMNYLDRCKRREIIINTKKHTIFIDFIRGILSINGEIKFQNAQDNAITYLKQHEAIIKKDFNSLCNYFEGIEVLKLIEKIENASLETIAA